MNKIFVYAGFNYLQALRFRDHVLSYFQHAALATVNFLLTAVLNL